jgi:hypothetical protein
VIHDVFQDHNPASVRDQAGDARELGTSHAGKSSTMDVKARELLENVGRAHIHRGVSEETLMIALQLGELGHPLLCRDDGSWVMSSRQGTPEHFEGFSNVEALRGFALASQRNIREPGVIIQGNIVKGVQGEPLHRKPLGVGNIMEKNRRYAPEYAFTRGVPAWPFWIPRLPWWRLR